jgi:hypothetical protein
MFGRMFEEDSGTLLTILIDFFLPVATHNAIKFVMNKLIWKHGGLSKRGGGVLSFSP